MSCGACEVAGSRTYPKTPRAPSTQPSESARSFAKRSLCTHGEDPMSRKRLSEWPRCWPRSVCLRPRRSWTPIRISSLAASSSASRWRWHSHAGPSSSCLDEPTTGLDVATQRHVLDTVRGLCRSYGVTAVYVTHDLAVIAEIADRVAVMYAGRLIELGPTKAVFESPAHPYTDGLLKAIPSPEVSHALIGMEGQPPSPGKRPVGCLFEPRCPHRHHRVLRVQTADGPRSTVDAHEARCFRAKEVVLASTGVDCACGKPAPRYDIWPRHVHSWLLRVLMGTTRDKQVLFDVGLQCARWVVRRRGWRVRLGQDNARALHHRFARELDRSSFLRRPDLEASAQNNATSTFCARCSTSSRTRTRR